MADDDLTDDPEEPVAAPSWKERLTAPFVRPPGTAAAPASKAPERPPTDREVGERIKLIDPLERRVGTIGVVIGVVLVLAERARYLIKPSTPVSTSVARVGKHCPAHFTYQSVSGHMMCVGNVVYSRSHWIEDTLVLLLFPLAMYISLRLGKRAPLGFTALLTGFAFGTTFGVLGFPFLLGGGWLLLRAYRVQKFGSPTAKAAIEGYTPKTRRQKQAEAAAASSAAKPGAKPGAPRTASRRGKKDVAKTTPTGRPVPEQNKRYTPKAPPKKKVTPPPS